MAVNERLILCCLVATAVVTATQAGTTWDKLRERLLHKQQNEIDAALNERTVEEVPGHVCPYFDVIEGKALFGFNTRVVDSQTPFGCMESCVQEQDFYCR